jgi:hypothetical protein
MPIRRADVNRATQQILEAARSAASGPEQQVSVGDMPAELRSAVQEAAGGAGEITLSALQAKLDEVQQQAGKTLGTAPSPLALGAQIAGGASPTHAAQSLAAGASVAQLMEQVLQLAAGGVQEPPDADPVNLRQGVGVTALGAAHNIAQGLFVSAEDISAQVASLGADSVGAAEQPAASNSATAMSAAQGIAQGGAVSPLALAAQLAGE